MKINRSLQALFVFLLSGFFAFSYKLSDKDPEKSTVSLTPTLRMTKSEVSNYEYRQFIKALKMDGKQDLAKKYNSDTTVWSKFPYTVGDPMIHYYFSHPAFNNYPVIGITHEGAIAYCEWKTELAMKEENESAIKKRVKGPVYILKYRLPTRAEWETAAKLNSPNAVYAGGWSKVKRNVLGKKEPNGYNFNHRIAEDNFSEDGYAYTGPVNQEKMAKIGTWRPKSFLKADMNGIYHLAGNVAELVSEKGITVGGGWNDFEDKARIGAINEFTEPNAYTGFRYVIEYTKRTN